MLHWPDSMFSYLEKDRLLFSQDAFGMHLASSERFADEIDESVLEHEAAKYYANILLPFSPHVTKLLEKVADLGLAFDLIAPDHGPVWRKRVDLMPRLYRRWAQRELKRKAVVTYDTMWGSTDLMARAIADGLDAGGARVKVMKLRAAHRSDVATELLDAGALVVGSPTINNNVFPTIADVLTYLRGLKPTGLVGAAFGSYGWSGESVKQIEEMLAAMKVELIADSVRVKYVPDDEALASCRALGEAVAKRLQTLPAPEMITSS
jgi:flavorubredoxin